MFPQLKLTAQSNNAHDFEQGEVYHCCRFFVRANGTNSVSLSKQQVNHVARLARLKLADGEFAEFVDKLSRIVDFVDQLQQANTENVVPMAHPLDQSQPLRADVVSEAIDRDAFQENAAAVEGGLYLVPKVLE